MLFLIAITTIIIQESRRLLPQQQQFLLNEFKEWGTFKFPHNMTSSEQMMAARHLVEAVGENLVFISPLPIMLARTSALASWDRTVTVFVVTNEQETCELVTVM